MNKVRQQYEQWIYPSPTQDLDQDFREGVFDLSDPALFRRKLWPRPVEPEKLKILVAGCGTDQAARLAHRNPGHEVVGLDFSEASLAHEAYLKNKHKLANLRLHHLGILDIDQLGEQFDLIVSTGVLHHLSDPDAGLRKLKATLAPHGVMSLMVYGWYARFGVYMMQEVFRLLGVEQTPAGIQLVRDSINALPAWHHVKPFVRGTPELNHDDAEVVDVFLHPTDRAYTVAQVLRWAADNGLRFQDWLDRYNYSLSARIPSSFPAYALASKLKPENQWQIVELVAQTLACHRFLLCHQERDIREVAIVFDNPDADGAWLSYVPHWRPPIEIQNSLGNWQPYVYQAGDRPSGPHGPALHQSGPVTWRRYAYQFTLDGPEAALFELVDGQATIAQIIKKRSPNPELEAGNRNLAFRLFARMHDWDHLVYKI